VGARAEARKAAVAIKKVIFFIFESSGFKTKEFCVDGSYEMIIFFAINCLMAARFEKRTRGTRQEGNSRKGK
jgi:hypothetical protein